MLTAATVDRALSCDLVFHHFGMAVQRPDGAFRMLRALGYRDGATAFDPLQAVHVAMRHHPEMPDVEVIWPGDGPSPIDKLIKPGDGRIYHLCFVAEDAEATLARWQAAGLEVVPVREPRPAVLFDGRPVSFHHIAGFGLIELIHGAGA